VTITGTNFSGASAVSFGVTAATSFTVNSATQISAVTPAGSAGAVNVNVTTAGGTVTDVGAYTYAAAPTITSFTPTSGPSGSTVTITGTNFIGTTQVEVGIPVTSFTVVSSTEIQAVIAPLTAQGVGIAVITPAGEAVDYTFTYTN
jgi:hypothetical protein